MKSVIILMLLLSLFLKSHAQPQRIQEITVVGDRDYQPFEFLSRDNVPQGLLIDIWNLWSKKTGIKVHFKLSNWEEGQDFIKKNTNAVIGGLLFSEKRTKTLDFSTPLFEVSTHLFIHNSENTINTITDIRETEVAVIKGYKSEDYVRSYYPHIRLQVFATNTELFQAVQNGKVKAFIHNYPTAFFHLSKIDMLQDFRNSQKPIYFNVMHAAIYKGNKKLLKLINDGFSEITPKEIKQLYDRWIGISPVRHYKWQWLAGIIGLLLILVGLFILWNNQLQKRVISATNALRDSEEKYKSIFNAGTDAIVTFDPDTYFLIDANSVTTEMFGYSFDELKDRNIVQVLADIHTDNAEAAETLITQVKNGSVMFYEWNAKHKDGHYFPVEVKLKLTNISGKNMLFASVRNITDKKNIQDKIIKSENRFRQLIDLLPLPLVIVNNFGETEYLNPAFEKQFGYTIQDFPTVSRWFEKAFPDVEYRKLIYAQWQGLKENHYVRDYAIDFLKITCKDGSVNHVDFECVEIENQYALIVFRDITEQHRIMEEKEELIKYLGQSNYELEVTNKDKKKAIVEIQQAKNELEEAYKKLEQALKNAEEANRLKSEFLAVMSHEIRTPMSSMLGFSQILYLSDNLDTQHKKYAEIIYSATNRLSKLLSDLLEISVIEAGGLKVEYNPFSMQTMIDDIYILFHSSFTNKGIRFETELENINIIYSDEIKIRQILFNLIGNAIKFTEKGQITVKAKIDDKNNTLIISVKDTGIGIDEINAKKVFDMFIQEDSGLSRKFGGTGLGLTICKRFVESIGGKIWLESQKGKGSEFFFTLPLQQIPDSFERIIQNENPSINGKLKILYSDDDPDILLLIGHLLEDYKSNDSKAVSNGKEALDEFIENPDYDLIILDIQTPVMDGVQCLQEIRKLNPDIPVIALTAYAMQSDKDRFLSIGFSDYFPKPIDMQKFRSLITGYITP